MTLNEAFETLVSPSIDGPRALETLAAVEQSHGQLVANQLLQTWLAQPVTAWSALAQAALMIAHRRTDVAVLVLEAAVAQLPDNIEVLDHLANALVRRAERGRAIEYWRDWTNRHPDDAMGWYKLGYHLIDQGEAAASVAALERARLLAPTMMAVLTNLYTARTLDRQPAASILDDLESEPCQMICYRSYGLFTA